MAFVKNRRRRQELFSGKTLISGRKAPTRLRSIAAIIISLSARECSNTSRQRWFFRRFSSGGHLPRLRSRSRQAYRDWRERVASAFNDKAKKKGRNATLAADAVITGEIGRGRALTTGFINGTIGTIRQVDFRVNINCVFHSLAEPSTTRAFRNG